MSKNKKKHKKFNKKCKFRYDDIRPNMGECRTARLAPENPRNPNSGGARALADRCVLKDSGNRRCLFLDKTHITCPFSNAKKHKRKGKRKFRGKWVKTNIP